MYAQLDDNDQLVGGQPVHIYTTSERFTYESGGLTFTAPKNWFMTWNMAEKAARHIFPIQDTAFDREWEKYDGNAPTFTFDGTTVFRNYTVIDVSMNRALNNCITALNQHALMIRDSGTPIGGYVVGTSGDDLAQVMLMFTAENSGYTFDSTYGLWDRPHENFVLLDTTVKRNQVGAGVMSHMEQTIKAYNEHKAWVEDGARTFNELKAYDVTAAITTPWPPNS